MREVPVMLRSVAAALVAVALWGHHAAFAHPHVWITGGADFGLDEEGRLARLHVTWIYDEFASLYLLNYLGVDPDGDQVFSEQDKATVLADQTNWPDEFEGDSYLFVDGKRRALGKAANADTRILETGQVEVTFERAVLEPFRPGAGTPAVVKVYDPTFYYAYELDGPAGIVAPEGHGCASEYRPVDPTRPELEALRLELAALGREETPEQQDVGALFADDLVLTCG